jgi:pSer/pThr/pTyr-binding forkhead associated (FHA) protein
MQVVLVMFRNDGERRSFSVVRNMTVIGRREDCDLRIPVGDVSRKHCRMVRTDDGIRIEDLGSSNGTHVNGQRVQESDLHAGDVVGIGPVQFIVQIDGLPDEDEMTPPAAAAVHDESSVVGQAVAPDQLVPDSAVLEEAVASEEFHVEPENTGDEVTIDDNEIVTDDALVDAEPLEEIPPEEAPAEDLALDEVELEAEPAELEEITDEEPPVGEFQAAEETPLEEIPAEAAADETANAPASRDSVEEITEEELGLEEFPVEELEPVENAPVAAAPAPVTTEPPPIAEDALNIEDPVEEPSIEHPAIEESLGGLEMLDEVNHVALEPAPAAEHVEAASLIPKERVEEVQPVNLEEDANDETDPAGLNAADESEWDFVIEETEGERNHHDFKIDLDAPQQQPHQ